MKNEQQINETKIWAIERIVKLTTEATEVREMIHRLTYNGSPNDNFNFSMQNLRVEMIDAQIEQLKQWIVQH